MRVIPKEPLGVIEFCESRFEVWDLDPAQIGLTKDQLAPFYDQMKMAREKYNLAVSAREAAVAATAAMHTEAAALRAMASAFVATIKAFATTGGPEGYPEDQILAIAQIDPPRTPGTGGPENRQSTKYKDAPGKATRISAGVTPTGAIRLVWQAKDAAASTGAFFTILRRLPRAGLAGEGGAGFTILGTSPGLSRTRRTAEFVDEGLPAGVGSVQYQIVSQRAQAVGEPSEVVTMTMGGGGLRAAA